MRPKKPRRNRKIVGIALFALTLVLFFVFTGRLTYLMLGKTVEGHDLSEKVNNLYASGETLQAHRGSIFDVNGESIAVDASSYKMVAVLTDQWSDNPDQPHHVTDKEETARVLAKYINMEESEILSILNQEGVAQVEFGSAGTNLSYETKSAIEEENLDGIVFEESISRLYPNGVFASHLVGIAQEDKENEQGQLTGVMGVEQYFDEDLSGENGKLEYEVDNLGYVIANEKQLAKEPVDGKDIYLTLDHSLQVFMENQVSQVIQDNPADQVTVNLMDAETGRLLASTQRPTFNASTLENIDATWQNFLVEYIYEPGSTFKLFTLGAAIEEGVYNPNHYYESGQVEVGGQTIYDWNKKGWGTISYLEGLARSSNVSFVLLGQQIGEETWLEYIEALGFGQEVGMPLANEQTGQNPYDTEAQKASTTFGQGISVTPAQMLQAFSAIANDGEMVKPYFVDRIVDAETGESQTFEKEVVGQPFSPETAQAIRRNAVEATKLKESTTKNFEVEGYDSVIKTGTSQVVDPETGRYASGANNYVYSVVGMAPADDPKFLLYVTVQNPTLNTFSSGSAVVEEIYRPIMQWALDSSALGDVVKNAESTKVPDVLGEEPSRAQEILAEAGFDVTQIGTGSRVVQQYPDPESDRIENQKVAIMTNGGMTMPDLTGWSKNDALLISEMTGKPFKMEGEGYVVSQNIPPGQNISNDAMIELTLSSEE